jgi:hypothetical protein
MTGARATIRVPETFFDGGCIADAFHGTLNGAAQTIAERGFHAVEEDGQHYGPGIYFFESDCLAACWFADKRRRETDGRQVAVVIHARVNLGRVFYANGIGVEIEKARRALSRQLGQDVPERVMFRLVCNVLREKNMIDSLKVVRKRTKPAPEPEGLGAEIVVLVFDARRVASPRIRQLAELKRHQALCIDLQ